MARMTFDGASHQLTLTDDKGRQLGAWEAYNNVDRHATLTHVPDGTYLFVDTAQPHPHRPASANGPYGSHGILRFFVPGHVGIGVHSGRANALYQPGPPHQTMGCIRTSDEAMQAIVTAIQTEPLTTISVRHNAQSAAHAH